VSLSRLKLSKLQFFMLFVAGIASPLLISPQSLSNQVTENTTTAIESQMTIWQAIVLGMVQGLTEFIPISSTAHLKSGASDVGLGGSRCFF
jgi:undecaprenyl-diphosphatase